MNQRSGHADDLEPLSPWVNELAQTFVSLSSDIALVLDAGGVITQVAQAGAEPLAPGASQWVGRAWADTVTAETRRKIELLLGDVASTGLARRREVSHPGGGGGSDIPVAYTAIRLGASGPVLAVGRDLRAIAAIQQRFLDAQQELERGYWLARQAEARARTLRQVATDALLVLDAESFVVLGANAVAGERLGTEAAGLAGRAAPLLFDAHSRGAVEDLLATARGGGRPVELRARVAGSHDYASVAATPFRAGDAQRLLLRLRSPEDGLPSLRDHRPAARTTGEAVVITDSNGLIRACDDAFVMLLGAQDEAAVVGRALADWLGDAAQPFEALLADARRDGLAERAALPLRSADRVRPAMVAAGWLTEGDQESIGFVMRPAGAGPGLSASAQRAFAQAWEVLDEQLGSASLPQMMRAAAALAEHHFIEAALQRCDGDVVAAARLLCVSEDDLGRRRVQRQDDAR